MRGVSDGCGGACRALDTLCHMIQRGPAQEDSSQGGILVFRGRIQLSRITLGIESILPSNNRMNLCMAPCIPKSPIAAPQAASDSPSSRFMYPTDHMSDQPATIQRNLIPQWASWLTEWDRREARSNVHRRVSFHSIVLSPSHHLRAYVLHLLPAVISGPASGLHCKAV